MTKTFSKVIAIVLSICMLFAVPVMANAEETATFALNGTSAKAVAGDWENDYIGEVVLNFKGSVDKLAATDALVVIYAGEAVYRTIKVSEAVVAIGNGEVNITVPFGNYVAHAQDYKFAVVEGAFTSADGAVNAESSIAVSGNDLVESLDVEHVSTKPIEKLIDWMYTWGAEGFWLDVINFVVSILNWFLTI